MQSEVLPWITYTVRDGYFETSDGTKLHYNYAIPENAKAAIIVVHGFCEFFGKYREVVWNLYNEGYAFFLCEQRGYGLSQREVENKELVYINTFTTYACDLKDFIEKVVKKEAPDLKRFIFSHSMGGAVTTLFLENFPDDVSAAVLASPLIKMNTKGFPEPIAHAVFTLMLLLGKAKKPLMGQKEFNPVENFPASGTLSPARYHHLFQQRLDDENYRTWAATYGWSIAAIRGTRRLQKHLSDIKTDLLLLTAGVEDRVDPKGFDLLLREAPNITALHFPDSKHEIFNSVAADRERFYKEVFAFFEEHL